MVQFKTFTANFLGYISRIWSEVPSRPIGTNLRVCLADINSCANFYRNRLDSVRGRILTLPIGLKRRR